MTACRIRVQKGLSFVRKYHIPWCLLSGYGHGVQNPAQTSSVLVLFFFFFELSLTVAVTEVTTERVQSGTFIPNILFLLQIILQTVKKK